MEQELDHKPAIAALSWRERFYSWLPTSKKALHKVMFRVGVLFSILCVIKLVMLVGFRKHLFEIHWRVGDLPFSPFNKLAFYGFAALVGINLWRLGKQCASVNTKAARAANACILTLGGLFILLTFHEGDKNWLHPVLNGILKWKDLESYFALNLFFRPPFLAAWLLGYAFTYYFFIRIRREYLIVQVTAVCGAAYIALCLRDLMIYRDALIIVNCIGWSCVLSSLGTRRPLGFKWIVSSFANIVICFVLFSGFSAMLQVSNWNPEFSILFLGSLIVFSGATAISLRRGFFNGWSWVLPFGLAAFLLFININYVGARSYNNLLCLGFLLPHYFLNEFLIAAAVLTFAISYFCWRPGGSIWWLDVLNLLIIVWTVLDLRFSQITGARLDWQAISLGLGETPTMIWRMSRPYLPAASIALFVITMCYGVLFKIVQRPALINRIRTVPLFTRGTAWFFLSFVMLAVAGRCLVERDKVEPQGVFLLAETSPWLRGASVPMMDKQTFDKTARELGMTELIEPSRNGAKAEAARDWNVVLVFQESTYNKHLSLFNGTNDTQPLLSKYKDRMEVFPKFFSNFAGSSTQGLPPLRACIQ